MPDLDASANNAAWLALVAGTIICFSGVLIGAFGAHWLDDTLRAYDRIATFELANRYQFYHGLALLLMGLLIKVKAIDSGRWPIYLMIIGVLLFSGSLYVLSLTNVGLLGAITPFGGTALLCAWGSFLLKLIKE